jgi:transposase-like protein
MRKGNCPECNAGPRSIQVWNTLHGNGIRTQYLKCEKCDHQFPVPKQPPRAKKLKPEHAEAIAIVRQFQAWRRGADTTMISPEKIGEAIDVLISLAEK